MAIQAHTSFDLLICDDGHFCINDQDVDEDEDKEEYWMMLEDVHRPSVCPYCKINVEHATFEDTVDGNEVWHFNRMYSLNSCSNCGFWELTGSEAGNKCMDSSLAVNAASVAAKFTDTVPEGCFGELAQHLRRNPEVWHTLNPLQLEQLVAAIFKANHSHCEVVHVGRPGDLGVDVLFVDDGGRRWLIQVKRRSKRNKAEGFETLQRVLGTLALTGNRHGIVATTADYFSRQLQVQRRHAAEQGFVIELLDKGKLNRMLSPLLPDRPWMQLIKNNVLPELDVTASDYLNQRVSSAADRTLF